MNERFANVYQDRRVLITGHTGFKGSWLSLWLQTLKARVFGMALPPESNPNHWELLNLAMDEERGDINDADAVQSRFASAQPEIVFHLAAQPLVLESYRDPVGTWQTNVMGTAHILDAIRRTASVKAAVIVTSDKCYENDGSARNYRETDTLGGCDPYSSSKAAVELLVSSYRRSYFSGNQTPLIATARAGNVLGGGDWSSDRLFPDIARARAKNGAVVIRSPYATRPWQHVLDCLAGYLGLGARLLQGMREMSGPWNFGPDKERSRNVLALLQEAKKHWPAIEWTVETQPGAAEPLELALDSERARHRLGWSPLLDWNRTVQWTAQWYREHGRDGTVSTRPQLNNYRQIAGGKL
jgi:CDP-glucose 4,6-dehydratase